MLMLAALFYEANIDMNALVGHNSSFALLLYGRFYKMSDEDDQQHSHVDEKGVKPRERKESAEEEAANIFYKDAKMLGKVLKHNLICGIP